ncbi:hypothetical protein ZWY2020_006618 [Hordeum vulgare]|nr:hypothetical protein ZWY2020_006618 [Hordeum vulgare]
MVVQTTLLSARACPVSKVMPRWMPAKSGWTKLNTDGSFIASTCAARGGMILRDDRGLIIYIAYWELRSCDSVLEAELEACREGLDLALHRTSLSIMVEMDSVETVSMLNAHWTDKSQHHILIEEILRLADLDAREICFTNFCRSYNNASHELTAYGRRTPRTAVRLLPGWNLF